MLIAGSEKLAEMTLYLAGKSLTDQRFGKVKLVKLLAYADFEAYARLGESMSGATYMRLEHGPAPRDLPGTLATMQAADDLQVQTVPRGAYTQTRYEPLRKADLSSFSAEEVDLMDEIVERFWSYGASGISEASHRDFAGWGLVEEFEEIPYRTALLDDQDKPSPELLARGAAALSRPASA